MALTFGATLAALAMKPHIWHIRELPESQFRLVPDWGVWWIRRLMNQSSKIIAISKYVEKYIVRKIRRVIRVDVIYDPAMSRADLNKIIPQQRIDACVTFGVVARFDESKKIDLAIRAFSIAAEQDDSIKLEIFGNGPRAETQYLVDLAGSSPFSGRITFHGYQSDQENIFKSIDCLIACAPHEAFGRAVAEAMLLGIPIIGTKTGGTAELLNIIEAGLMFDGTAESLASKILTMARDWNLYQAFSREALTRSGPLFLADSVQERFIQAFSDAAQSASTVR
jgi:glycosyltransferase involved in cell wall biosynthesis